MAPGPITVATLAHGRQDPLAGVWINIGHSIAEVPLIFVLLLGLEPFLESENIRRVLSIGGGLVMVWMGQGLIRKGNMETIPKNCTHLQWNPIYDGAILTALNPYWLLWWMTVGAGLISRALNFGAATVVALMIVIHLLCDFSWGTFLSFSAYRSKNILRPEKWGYIEMGCGAVLILFGGIFLYEGIWKEPN
jgi:threonine/homoserine/homoserine lactone efflux protein